MSVFEKRCLLFTQCWDGMHASVLWLLLTAACLNVNTHFRKLICDSRSSDSFAERSTVDYIVPGEMELMSAVRWETELGHWYGDAGLSAQSSDQQLASVPSSQKNTEKSGEIKFLPRIIVKAAAVEFRKFEFRFKYFDQIAKSFQS